MLTQNLWLDLQTFGLRLCGTGTPGICGNGVPGINGGRGICGRGIPKSCSFACSSCWLASSIPVTRNDNGGISTSQVWEATFATITMHQNQLGALWRGLQI